MIPTENIVLTIGTWPVEPGQLVWVPWEFSPSTARDEKERVSRNGGATLARTATGPRSWVPFADVDHASYTVHGSSGDGTVQTAAFPIASFRCISRGCGISISRFIVILRRTWLPAASGVAT